MRPRALTRAFLPPWFDSAAAAKAVVRYGRGDVIFIQGDACEHVMYIQSGGVKLSVQSKTGRKAVVAMLGPEEFFGEGCLAGHPFRKLSATAITPSAILSVRREKMMSLLHTQHAMSDRFISHMLARNIEIEEDLMDQLCTSREKRLASALLLLARYGTEKTPLRVVPRVSHGTLADMIGATGLQVSGLLNKFTRLGFIEYERERLLKINSSLLSVVLHD